MKQRHPIRNPVLKGFNPDPSIVRVEDDYYIATSTFEWFPGVQIHHSRDLVNWELLTRPLNRVSQLDLTGVPDSGGIWAPCLSYSQGLFYLIYTNVKHWKCSPYKIAYNYLVTAESITGPWSEPVFLNSSGFDPSLFHDEDGRKWLLNMIWDHRKGHNPFAGILLQEFCPHTQSLIGPIKEIFKGTALGLVEGPHLYRKNGYYYLLTAEGGTQYTHACTLARSRSIDGPYELHPNPYLLTSIGKPEAELQKAGHGSLVETQNGEWYLAHLCGRPIDGKHCILGRETALQKCVWREDGWPYLDQEDSAPKVTVTAPGLPPSSTAAKSWDGSFNRPELDIHFQSLRRPITEEWLSLTERPGFLRLHGQEPTISQFQQSLIARRVQAFVAEVSTRVEYQPENFQQMAGLIAYYDTTHHYYLRISHENSVGRCLNIIRTESEESEELLDAEIPLPATGPVELRLSLNHTEIQFFYAVEDGNWREIGPALESKILSDDYDHLGFTGAFVGICAQDISGTGKYADFQYFKYLEAESSSSVAESHSTPTKA